MAGGRRRSSVPRRVTAPSGAAALQPGERLVLAAFAAILVITASWWAAALWPLPATTPGWVVRARAACFGVEHSGLPHAGGWILLVGSPISLLAALGVIAGPSLRSAFRRSLATLGGRLAFTAGIAAFLAIMVASGTRAAAAAGYSVFGTAAGTTALAAAWDDDDGAAPLRRLDDAPGDLGLRDQRGERIDLDRFAGEPLLVTFAFGHCETICPVIVHEALAARAALGDGAPPLVIVTVDPWRDAPPRLPHIAATWRLDDDAYLLGGDVSAVERVLDSWRVDRARDVRTGDIVHPSLVYVLDGSGRIRYAVPGWRSRIVAALTELTTPAEM